jgi:unconventional prefoldin RPB5 interactor 1
MPGKLVHTNEILVLLGDNWFVEKSAKQARDVVTRRLVGVEKHLEDLYKEKNIIESQFKWTADVMSVEFIDLTFFKLLGSKLLNFLFNFLK